MSSSKHVTVVVLQARPCCTLAAYTMAWDPQLSTCLGSKPASWKSAVTAGFLWVVAELMLKLRMEIGMESWGGVSSTPWHFELHGVHDAHAICGGLMFAPKSSFQTFSHKLVNEVHTVATLFLLRQGNWKLERSVGSLFHVRPGCTCSWVATYMHWSGSKLEIIGW
jgi:hypothetical protein